jgi:hypothetical protein
LILTVIDPTSLTMIIPDDDKDEDQRLALARQGNATRGYHIIGRTDIDIAHLERRRQVIDDNKTTTTTTTTDSSSLSSSFFFDAHHINTFVDLYIASTARCISMGLGRFAYLAAKISSSSLDDDDLCWTRHIANGVVGIGVIRQWGMGQIMYKEVPKCPV